MANFDENLEIIKTNKFTKNIRQAIYECLDTIRLFQANAYPDIQESIRRINELEPKVKQNQKDIGILNQRLGTLSTQADNQKAQILNLMVEDMNMKQSIRQVSNDVLTATRRANEVEAKLPDYQAQINQCEAIAEGNSAELEELYEMVNSDKMIGFEGTYVNAKDSIKGMTANTEIRGRTIQNLWDVENTPLVSQNGQEMSRTSLREYYIPQETYTCFVTLNSSRTITVSESQMVNLFRVNDGSGQPLGGFTGTLKANEDTRCCFSFKTLSFDVVNEAPHRSYIKVQNRVAPPFNDLLLTTTDIVIVHGDWTNKEQLPYFKGMRSACDVEKNFKPEISNVARYAKAKLLMYLNPNPGVEYNKLVNSSSSTTYMWPVKKGKVYGYKNGGNRNVVGFFNKKPGHGVVGIIVKEMSTSDINKCVLDVPGDGWIVWYVNDSSDGSSNPGVCVLQYNEGQTPGSGIIRPEPLTIQTNHNNGLMSISGVNDVDNFIGDVIKRTANGIQVVENITKVVLDGRQDHIYRRNSETNRYVLFYLELFDQWQLVSDFGICEEYPVLPYHKAAASQFNFKYIKPSKAKYIFINVKKTDLTPYGGTDVEHLRKYLAAYPVAIYCKTKTTRYVDIPRVNDMEFKTNDIPNGTLITSGNEIAPIIKTMVPCDPSAVIATLRRSNLSLQDDNLKLRTRVANLDETARQQDLHQAAVDLDVDFRLYMMERSNPNSREQLSDEAIVKTEPSLQFNLMKKLIDAGMYDKNDFINKALYYTDGGILSQNEYKQITEMMKGGNI